MGTSTSCATSSARSRVLLAADVATAPRRLRSGNHLAGLYITNAVAGMSPDSGVVLCKVEDAFSSRIVASGRTGGLRQDAPCRAAHCGHGQPPRWCTPARPRLTRHSHARRPCAPSDDCSVSQFKPWSFSSRLSMPPVSALATGCRCSSTDSTSRKIHGCGKAQLAALETVLAKYPYVLLVCTIRPEFQDEALPDGTTICGNRPTTKKMSI
jgi:hypothetical protein